MRTIFMRYCLKFTLLFQKRRLLIATEILARRKLRAYTADGGDNTCIRSDGFYNNSQPFGL